MFIVRYNSIFGEHENFYHSYDLALDFAKGIGVDEFRIELQEGVIEFWELNYFNEWIKK